MLSSNNISEFLVLRASVILYIVSKIILPMCSVSPEMDKLSWSLYLIMSNDKKVPYKAGKVWFKTFHAALGSFIFSYNIGLFTSNQPCVSASLDWGHNEDYYIPIMSSLLPLGALFGALGAGFLSKNMGRRQNLIIADVIIIIASVVSVLPFTVAFGIGRFLSGFGIGNFSMLCPLYINEIAPADISGKIGSMVMFFGCLGSLFAFALALPLPTSNYKHDPMNNWWIGMFLFQGIVASIQMIIFIIFFHHETPHWLLNKGETEKALESLETIYNKEYTKNILEKMKKVSTIETPDDSTKYKDDFSYKQIL